MYGAALVSVMWSNFYLRFYEFLDFWDVWIFNCDYCQSMKTIFLNYQTETTLMLLSSCDAPIVHST